MTTFATYIAGQLVRLSTGTGFVDVNGNPTDPTVVKLGYRPPEATTTTWLTYGSSGIVKDGVGLYHFDLNTTGFVAGHLVYEWVGDTTSLGENEARITLPYL